MSLCFYNTMMKIKQRHIRGLCGKADTSSFRCPSRPCLLLLLKYFVHATQHIL